jgi:hypothetical protein
MHQRLRPRRHRLEQRAFRLLLDLSELDGLNRRLRLFSRNRSNMFAFFDSDHGDGSGRPLRAQVEARLAAVGVDLGGGAIRLLTMPRLLGYVFNPISIVFSSGYTVSDSFTRSFDMRVASIATSSFAVFTVRVAPITAVDVDPDFLVTVYLIVQPSNFTFETSTAAPRVL